MVVVVEEEKENGLKDFLAEEEGEAWRICGGDGVLLLWKDPPTMGVLLIAAPLARTCRAVVLFAVSRKM